MMNVPRLPNDVVLEVFELLIEASPSTEDKWATYRSVCLVSRSWLACARATFAHSISLNRATQLPRALAPGFPLYHLASLTIGLNSEGCESPGVVRDGWDAAMALLRRADNLQSLALPSGVRELDRTVVQILRKKKRFHTLLLLCQQVTISIDNLRTTSSRIRAGPEDWRWDTPGLRVDLGSSDPLSDIPGSGPDDPSYKIGFKSMTTRRVQQMLSPLKLRHLTLLRPKRRDPHPFQADEELIKQPLESLTITGGETSAEEIIDLVGGGGLRRLDVSVDSSRKCRFTPFAFERLLLTTGLGKSLVELSLEFPWDDNAPCDAEHFLSGIAAHLPCLVSLSLSGPALFTLDGIKLLPDTLESLTLEGHVSHMEVREVGELLRREKKVLPRLRLLRCASVEFGAWGLKEIKEAREVSGRKEVEWEIRVAGVWAAL